MSGEQWFVFTAAVGCFSFFLWEAIQLIRLRGKTGAADAVVIDCVCAVAETMKKNNSK